MKLLTNKTLPEETIFFAQLTNDHILVGINEEQHIFISMVSLFEKTDPDTRLNDTYRLCEVTVDELSNDPFGEYFSSIHDLASAFIDNGFNVNVFNNLFDAMKFILKLFYEDGNIIK